MRTIALSSGTLVHYHSDSKPDSPELVFIDSTREEKESLTESELMEFTAFLDQQNVLALIEMFRADALEDAKFLSEIRAKVEKHIVEVP